MINLYHVNLFCLPNTLFALEVWPWDFAAVARSTPSWFNLNDLILYMACTSPHNAMQRVTVSIVNRENSFQKTISRFQQQSLCTRTNLSEYTVLMLLLSCMFLPDLISETFITRTLHLAEFLFQYYTVCPSNPGWHYCLMRRYESGQSPQ